MRPIPESHRDLLQDTAHALAYIATLMPDGTPQLTPIWFNSDGIYIFINSTPERVKSRNMRDRPSVAVVIQDPNDTYRYIEVRGHVVEMTEQGALQHMSQLSEKYRGRPWQPVEGQVRIKCTIQPDHVSVDD